MVTPPLPPDGKSNSNSGKPKLLVILGAGSSISCGMPSVSDIDEKMKDWSREWMSSSGVSGRGVFNDLWEIVETYYNANHYGIRANYENVLGEMTALAIWLTPGPFGNPLRGAVKDGTPASSFAWPPGEEKNVNFYRILIINEQNFLLGKLAGYMREHSRSLDTGSSEFAAYKKILKTLRDKFDLGIYNLNCDNVAWSAVPEAFNGFNGGAFEPLRVSLRREWEFIYHLHGSVHHCISSSDRNPSIVWRDELKGQFLDHQSLALDMAQEFRPIPLTTLIAGGFKLDQILADPYQTFYATLVRHVHEADAILIAGYGFGDLHVNRVLRNRFEHPAGDAALPQVVVLEKSPETKLQTASLQIHDFWAYQLTHTLNVRFHTTEEHDRLALKAHVNREPTVSQFIQNNQLETSMPSGTSRVAIWHGGFIETLCSLDMIVYFLCGTR